MGRLPGLVGGHHFRCPCGEWEERGRASPQAAPALVPTQECRAVGRKSALPRASLLVLTCRQPSQIRQNGAPTFSPSPPQKTALKRNSAWGHRAQALGCKFSRSAGPGVLAVPSAGTVLRLHSQPGSRASLATVLAVPGSAVAGTRPRVTVGQRAAETPASLRPPACVGRALSWPVASSVAAPSVPPRVQVGFL